MAAFGAYVFLRGRGGDDRQQQFRAAERAFRAKDYDKARLLARAYLDEFGKDASVLYMLGLAETRSGRMTPGVSKIQEALRLDPKLVPAALFLAVRAVDAQRYPEALRFARQALSSAKEREETSARYLLGILLARAEMLNVGEAVDHLERVVEAGLEKPELARALLSLGQLYRMRESAGPAPNRAGESFLAVGKAATVLRELLREEPGNGDYRLRLARCEFDLGEYGSALASLREPFESAEAANCVALMRWKCLWKLGRTDEADVLLREFIASGPPPALLHSAVAFYRSVGRNDLGDDLLERALTLHPHHRMLLLDGARVLFGKGDLDGVEVLVSRALEDDPGNRTARLLAAELELARCESPEEVETRLRALAGAEDAPARMRLKLAALLLESSSGSSAGIANRKEAGELLRSLDGEKDLRATDLEYLELLKAKHAFARGWTAQAHATLKELIRRKPSHLQAHLLAASVCQATGNSTGQIMAIDASMALGGRTPELLRGRAAALLRLGAPPDQARRDVEEAISLGSATVEDHILVARTFLAETPPSLEQARDRLLLAAAIPGEGAAARVFLARVYLDTGARDEALVQVEAALRDPADPEVRLEATSLLADLRSDPQTGELTPEARATFEDYIRVYPEHLSARFRYADLLLRHGDTEAARSSVEEVLRETPDDVSALVLMYEILEAEDSVDEAGEVVRRLGEVSPESAPHRYLEGRHALLTGETTRAAELLRKAFELDPGRAVVAYHLARALHRIGKFPEARQALDDSLRLDPRSLDARFLLADVAFDQGRALLGDSSATERAEALDHLRRSLRENPGHLGALAHLIQSFLAPGGSAEAHEIAGVQRHVDELIRRLETGSRAPEDPKVRKSLAACYRLKSALACRRQDWATLTDTCRLEVALRPKDGPTRYRMALALHLSGETEPAIEMMREAREQAPDSWVILSALTEMLGIAGRSKEALPHLTEWTAENPEDGAGSLLHGRVLLEAGRPDESLVAVRRALKLSPDLLRGAEYLTEILVGLGRAQEAVAALMEHLPTTLQKGEIQFIAGRVRLQADFESEEGRLLLERALAAGFRNRQYRVGCTVLLMRVLNSRRKWGDTESVGLEFGRWLRGSPELPPDSAVRRLAAEAYSLLGVALFRLGEHYRAESAYRKSLVYRPEYGPAENNLAALLLQIERVGSGEEALGLAEGVVAREPEVSAYRDTLASALVAAGRPEEALREYDRALSLSTARLGATETERIRSLLRESLAKTRLRKARTLKALNRDEEAGEALRRAAKDMPGIEKDPEYREVLALIGG